MANEFKITFSDGKVFSLSEKTLSELSKGQAGISGNVTVPRSYLWLDKLSPNWQPTYNAPKNATNGINAGTYTLQNLLNQLVHLSHCHTSFDCDCACGDDSSS